MGVLRAWVDGWRRVLCAPGLVASLSAFTVLLALPLAPAAGAALAPGLGQGAGLAGAGEWLWQAAGLGHTLVPGMLGIAAAVRMLFDAAHHGHPELALPAAAVMANATMAMFLAGGVLDRLARGRVVGSYAFFAACGLFFFRVLRLVAIAAAAYVLLFLVALLAGADARRLLGDAPLAGGAGLPIAGVLLVGLLWLALSVIVDYALIRLVVEDRRSAVGALTAALRFVRRHPAAVLGLYALNAALFVAAVVAAAWLFAALAPGLALTLALHFYLVLRVGIRLAFSATQIALFQDRLAHAGYTARPLPAWPDSASAEAISPR